MGKAAFGGRIVLLEVLGLAGFRSFAKGIVEQRQSEAQIENVMDGNMLRVLQARPE